MPPRHHVSRTVATRGHDNGPAPPVPAVWLCSCHITNMTYAHTADVGRVEEVVVAVEVRTPGALIYGGHGG